jgi:cysteine desulfurase
MIYFDHSATTQVAPEVLDAMLPFLKDQYGNPSSIYALASRSRGAVEDARRELASYIGADPREVIFTGCGSESDNHAIKGTAWALRDKGRHIITSAVEHHAVLDACHALERDGYEVTVIPVDQDCMVDAAQVAAAIRNDTILVSIMHANNEVGSVQPVAEIGKICKERGVVFHTDAVQSLGKVPVNVNDLNVDLLTVSGHKVHAPKGVGALYMRRGTKLRKLIDGGGQELNRRAGTENVAGIVGFGEAVKLLKEHGEAEVAHTRRLRDRIIEGVLGTVPHTVLTGHPEKRLPNLASFCIHYIEGEGILLSLDMWGICASSGSACTSGSLDPSHVLLAMGFSHAVAHGSLRLSLGRGNTDEEVDTLLQVLPTMVERLRAMSPLWSDAVKRGEV